MAKIKHSKSILIVPSCSQHQIGFHCHEQKHNWSEKQPKKSITMFSKTLSLSDGDVLTVMTIKIEKIIEYSSKTNTLTKGSANAWFRVDNCKLVLNDTCLASEGK